MTLLITGGAGFIGSQVIASLGDAAQIVVLDNMHPQVHGERASNPRYASNVEFIRGDVTDPTFWDSVLRKHRPTTVLHLAAETGTGQSLRQASRHTHVNVNGTAEMLDAFSRASFEPEAIILTSSRAVYGEGMWLDADTQTPFYADARSQPLLSEHEWLPRGKNGQIGTPLPHDASSVFPRPSNVYAATKLAQENILAAWCTALGVSLSILRLQNVYGAGQAVGNPYTGVLTHFARVALAGEVIEVYEGGDIVRDFVSVRDVADAILASIRSPAAPDAYRLVDIGSGRARTLLEVAEVLAQTSGAPKPRVTDNYRLGDVRAAFANIDAAGVELDYKAKVDLSEGLRELVGWVKRDEADGEN